MSTPTTVFVAGATGFIGKHIVKQLLEGGYYVIGSVRSKEKGDALHVLLSHPNFNYEVVEEVEAKGAFDLALKKYPTLSVFIDAATPLPIGTNYDKQLIKRSAKGIKHIFSSIKEYGPHVKKVVMTSSIAACMNLEQVNDPTFIVDPSKWNPDSHHAGKDNSANAYFYAKAAAEKEAWDFVQKDACHFTLATVLPGYTLGPQAFDTNVTDILNTSSEIVNKIADLSLNDDIPNYGGLFVDVRDVARAHILAFENPKAAGKRLILVSEEFSAQLIVNILRKLYPSWQLPAGEPGRPLLGLQFNNEETQHILGFELVPLVTSVKDTYDQVLKVKGIL
ncbi:putative NADPH-dependent methylglyoxal reductase GRP2 [Spathaspora sp. JA1]|nr:putative NADPH-dependent methylglyoxal reductase GRP2 [Spathaspora sp. JA1]